MAQLLTILVLDKDAAMAQKVLASDQSIMVSVASVEQFRYFIERSACDVWLCNLTTEGLDFRADVELARKRNPHTRVILTGPALLAGNAAEFVQQGLAAVFIPKPWRLLVLRQAVFRNNTPSSGVDEVEKPSAAIASDAPVAAVAKPAAVGVKPIIINARPVVVSAKPSMSSTSRIAHAAEAAAARKPGLRLARAPVNISQARLQQTQPLPIVTLEEPRYRLDKLLGEGGVGKVYRAQDLLLDTKVAVKILRQDFVRDEGVLQALKNEAKICMQLTHPHIVRFYDFGQRSGTYFIVMEYVEGQTLYDTMQNPGSRDHGYIRNVAIAIGAALSYAHAHGVLHNDITPGNVMIGDDGVLKLIDFGIASVANLRREKTEFVFGTPAYMSPEQLRCDPVLDATTDVFAMGVLFHQMLTGLLPQAEDATNKDLASSPRPLCALLPKPVAAVLDIALAFDPAQRWHTVAELVAALDVALGA